MKTLMMNVILIVFCSLCWSLPAPPAKYKKELQWYVDAKAAAFKELNDLCSKGGESEQDFQSRFKAVFNSVFFHQVPEGFNEDLSNLDWLNIESVNWTLIEFSKIKDIGFMVEYAVEIKNAIHSSQSSTKVMEKYIQDINATYNKRYSSDKERLEKLEKKTSIVRFFTEMYTTRRDTVNSFSDKIAKKVEKIKESRKEILPEELASEFATPLQTWLGFHKKWAENYNKQSELYSKALKNEEGVLNSLVPELRASKESEVLSKWENEVQGLRTKVLTEQNAQTRLKKELENHKNKQKILKKEIKDLETNKQILERDIAKNKKSIQEIVDKLNKLDSDLKKLKKEEINKQKQIEYRMDELREDLYSTSAFVDNWERELRTNTVDLERKKLEFDAIKMLIKETEKILK